MKTSALVGTALAAALALAAAPAARACSVCACGDPLRTSSDPAAISGRLRLQLDTEYLRIDAGNEETPALKLAIAELPTSSGMPVILQPLSSTSRCMTFL